MRIVTSCMRTNAQQTETEFLSFNFQHIRTILLHYCIQYISVCGCIGFPFLCSFLHALQLGEHTYNDSGTVTATKTHTEQCDTNDTISPCIYFDWICPISMYAFRIGNKSKFNRINRKCYT